MDRINIGFDIDGVVLRYSDEFSRLFKLFGGKGDVENPKSFGYFDCVNESDYNALYLSHGYIMQSILKMHVDFIPIMNFMVKEVKQPMQFITARQEKLSKQSAEKSLTKIFEFLYGNVPQNRENNCFAQHWINIQCVNNLGDSKLPFIEHFEMKYFVEDRRKTCLELSKAGIICFMPRRSWNTLPENTNNIIQYNDSSEIVKYLRYRHS